MIFLEVELEKFDLSSTKGLTDLVRHSIEVPKDVKPVNIPPYRRSPTVAAELRRQVLDLLEKGYIRESNSPWSCSPVMVPKANGELRFCVDFRPINRVSIIPANPLPNLLRILSSLHGAVFITTMDLKKAFHQLLMLEDSIKYTAFSVEGLGHFEWVRMPYGLAGAPGTF